MSRIIYAVVGRGYGDEGKGRVTDILAAKGEKVLVIRHNGGAQSGHTVENGDKRFVFHELSSGSFRGADTLWVDTFLPDLYKLSEELEEFEEVSGIVPRIYAEKDTAITIIDDIFLNMILEISRQENRHGSCGMGINEADLRTKAGFGITIGELKNMNEDDLVNRLKAIRKEYYPARFSEEQILNKSDYGNINNRKEEASEVDEYLSLMEDENVLTNFASVVLENAKKVNLVENLNDFFKEYDTIIFESGQGLLLDCDRVENYPNVTASKTGLANVYKTLEKTEFALTEAVFVARSYVTKHGAGELKNECYLKDIGELNYDLTNIPNDWQGSLRYAKYDSFEDLIEPVEEEVAKYEPRTPSLVVTHLDETNNCIVTVGGNIPFKDCKSEKIKIYDVSKL